MSADRDRFVRLGLFTAILVGVIVRALPVLASQMPLGDGGLFMAMIDDIRQAGFPPPERMSYNGLDIPFVYPPLALFAAAYLGELTGVATLELLRILPMIGAIGCLIAFSIMARAALPAVAATGATLGYAVLPHAFDWLVAGGGITRGVGLILVLVAMAIAARTRLDLRSALLVGALLGVSALAHPQTPVFGAIGCAVLAYPGRPMARAWARWLAGAGAVAIVIATTWLAAAFAATGVFPLAAAGHRLDPLGGLARLSSLEFTGAAFMDVVGPLAILGAALGLLTGRARIPVLVLVTYLVGPGGGEFIAAVAWSLLAGIGLAAIIDAAHTLPTAGRHQFLVGASLCAVGLAFGIFSSLGSAIHQQSKLQAVTPAQAEAMEWVRNYTEPDARFMVATVDAWGNDEVSEWFPTLSDRQSFGTVQGSEWLGAAEFRQREEAHLALVECIGATAGCYRDAAVTAGLGDAYLFVPKGRLVGPLSPADCCPALRATLADAGYEIIYDGPGATIARPAD